MGKRKTYTQESVLQDLEQIFGDLYDYSKVQYQGLAKPVTLYCKKHHIWFEKTPEALLKRHCGCPVCLQEHKKEDYVKRAETRRQTMLSKYGVENIMQTELGKTHLKQSIQDKYGVDNIMQHPDTVKRAQKTNQERYGATSYLGSNEGRKRILATNLERYGAENFMQSEARYDVLPEMRQKAIRTQQERYGASHWSQSEAFRNAYPVMKAKEYATKEKHQSFQTSECELELQRRLEDVFGKENVKTQYRSEQYPYLCDFYIVSREMYIELNAHWSHYYRPFLVDEAESDAYYQSLLQTKETKSSKQILDVWTKRDVEKRMCAKEHHLNYLVFWDDRLRDVDVWFAENCPDGQDYDTMYSWLPKRTFDSMEMNTLFGFEQNLSNIVQQAQMSVFYKREIALWQEKTKFRNGLSLQMWLYYNRLQQVQKSPSELSDLDMLRTFGVSGLLHRYSVFRSKGMRELLEKYPIQSVYDPFMGWGERLLLCHTLGISYEGVDINLALQAGYEKMCKQYGITMGQFSFTDSRKYIPPEVDAVMTCPPYLDKEIYSDIGLENCKPSEFFDGMQQIFQMCWHQEIKYVFLQTDRRCKNGFMDVLQNIGYDILEMQDKKARVSHLNKTRKSEEFETILVFVRRER